MSKVADPGVFCARWVCNYTCEQHVDSVRDLGLDNNNSLDINNSL